MGPKELIFVGVLQTVGNYSIPESHRTDFRLSHAHEGIFKQLCLLCLGQLTVEIL